MSFPILSIRSLSKSFGIAPALSNIDLDVCVGEILGVAGPRGAGKSTLLLCAAGILKPSFGSVVVSGRRITSARDSYDVVYVPPRRIYYPFLTVRDTVSCYSAKLARETPALSRSIDSSIEHMLLIDQAEQRVGSLGTGQVLCVALAQAIVGHPRVLLLDAPLEGMDVASARIGREAILRAAEAVAAVIITTRERANLTGITSRNVFIRDGRLSSTGTKDRLVTRVAERQH